MKIQPIIINGLPQSGKDTVIGLIKDYCNRKFAFRTFSSVDPIKGYLTDSLGWNGEKDEDSRNLISAIKMFWSKKNNGPNRYLMEKIINICKENETNDYMDDYVIVFQIREIDEINNLCNMVNALSLYYTQIQKCKIVTVLRDKCNRDIQTNSSDKINTGLMKEMSDYTIWNNFSLGALEVDVNKMMQIFTENMDYYRIGEED